MRGHLAELHRGGRSEELYADIAQAAPYHSAIVFEYLSVPDEKLNELRHGGYVHEAREARAAI